MGDPRVFFAAERTLLAWIRTGLTVMAFGFVVARFGLFLDLLARQGSPVAEVGQTVFHSTMLGLSLILIGVFCLFSAILQHRAFLKTVPPEDAPVGYNPNLALMTALLLGLVGLAVAAFLAFDT